jgi:Ca2+/Na+ antiporter
MRTNIGLFWLLAVFFFLAAVAYTVWAVIAYGHPEWVGTVALVLAAALGVFLAFYLARVYKSQGGEMPEDRLDASIEDGDSEMGHYSPWSWWPIVLAGALAITFLGIAVGLWVILIGIPLIAVALVGWVYEYYRGNFAR